MLCSPINSIARVDSFVARAFSELLLWATCVLISVIRKTWVLISFPSTTGALAQERPAHECSAVFYKIRRFIHNFFCEGCVDWVRYHRHITCVVRHAIILDERTLLN